MEQTMFKVLRPRRIRLRRKGSIFNVGRTFWIALLSLGLIAPSVNVAAKTSAPQEPVVTLDLYVMSQCPFGTKAENVVFPAARSLGPLVDLNLYFIANEVVSPEGLPTFKSLHGQGEVDENIRHLCAQKHAPKLYMDFILERNVSNAKAPDWQAAAKKSGIDPAVLESCATGEEGKKLFSDNIKFAEKRNATASPTIDINGAQYRGARSLRGVTLALCDVLQANGVPLPASCEDAKKLPPDPVNAAGGGCGPDGAPARPAPVAFDVRVVVEKDCAICAPTLPEEIKQQHPAAKIITVDAASPEGRALIDRYHVQTLPFYLLDKGVEREHNFSTLMNSFYTKTGDGYTLKPGSTTYAASVQLKRQRTPKHLDLFVEALSPFSARAESDLMRLLVATKAKDLTFSIHYLVQETATAVQSSKFNVQSSRVRKAALEEVRDVSVGPLTSRRGEDEITESLRQVCLFQHASAGTFFTYLTCRNQNLLDASRADTCLQMAEPVSRCIAGGEGEALLRQDAALVRELDLRSGPMVLWENRYGPFGWHAVDWSQLIDK